MFLHIDGTGSINATSVYLPASENITALDPVIVRRYVYTNVTNYEIAQRLAEVIRQAYEKRFNIGGMHI